MESVCVNAAYTPAWNRRHSTFVNRWATWSKRPAFVSDFPVPLLKPRVRRTSEATMFGRRKQSSELDPPPIAGSGSDAVEVLRVWAAPGAPQQLTLRTCWKDPEAGGFSLPTWRGTRLRRISVRGRTRSRRLSEFANCSKPSGHHRRALQRIFPMTLERSAESASTSDWSERGPLRHRQRSYDRLRLR